MWTRASAVVAMVGLLAWGAGAATTAATTPPPDPERPVERVVVRGAGDGHAARHAVEAVGGTATTDLPIVDGVAAEVPADSVGALAAHPAVVAVSPDSELRVQSAGHSSSSGGPPSAYPRTMRADRLHAAGTTGSGVRVAVVDTGIAEVPDLAGRIVTVENPDDGRTGPCADFSGERTCVDGYGHGTFMAGIIAGDGTSSDGRWTGIAPDAELVSVKIAGRDGSSDVSKMLAAVQWVVSYRDTYDIEVLNLSLGTNSTQSWDVDPLNYAVQRAWEAGITVVVAASNMGPAAGTISKPADDPWVLTVGATDDRGTPGLGDDRIPDFSSRGPTAHGLDKPDVAAPGAEVVSLRSPGSTLDQLFPSRIDGDYGQGSGTSMSAAAVSGAAALLLEDEPGRAPGDVKGALMDSARPVAGGDHHSVGAGAVDLEAAATIPPGAATTGGPGRSNGTGLLHASRGDVQVRVHGGLIPTVLTGSMTAQLLLWDPVGFLLGDWNASTWRLSPLAQGRWYATTWHADPWSGGSMDDLDWAGVRWHGVRWHETHWHGTWQGSTSPDGSHPDHYGQPALGAAWYGVWR